MYLHIAPLCFVKMQTERLVIAICNYVHQRLEVLLSKIHRHIHETIYLSYPECMYCTPTCYCTLLPNVILLGWCQFTPGLVDSTIKNVLYPISTFSILMCGDASLWTDECIGVDASTAAAWSQAQLGLKQQTIQTGLTL